MVTMVTLMITNGNIKGKNDNNNNNHSNINGNMVTLMITSMITMITLMITMITFNKYRILQNAIHFQMVTVEVTWERWTLVIFVIRH